MATTFTDPIIADVTRIKKIHIDEIRDYLTDHIDSRDGHPLATTSLAGLMSAGDKFNLDNLSFQYNTYTAGVDSLIVTSPLKATGGANGANTPNAVAGFMTVSIDPATTSTRGTMSAAHWNKLEGIEPLAKNYSHPADHPASMITQTDTNLLFVTAADKANWNAKQQAVSNTTPGGTSGLLTGADKIKIDLSDSFPIGTVIMYSSMSHVTGIYPEEIGAYFNMSNGSPLILTPGPNPFAKWRILKDMEGRFPLSASSNKPEGEKLGVENVTLTSNQLPIHHHAMCGDDQIGADVQGPRGAPMLTLEEKAGRAELGDLNYDAKSTGGGGRQYRTKEYQTRGESHSNMPPYFTLYFLVKVLN